MTEQNYNQNKMNKVTTSIILLVLLMATSINAQNEFITTWLTDNSGTTNATSIRIPCSDMYTYNFDVDWENDGVFDDFGVTTSITHDYGNAGQYQVAIRGTFPAIAFNREGDCEKLLSIDQWGTITWQDMHKAFDGCVNLTLNATGAPDLSVVSDMSYMFYDCTVFNGEISHWNVSNITLFYATFGKAAAFNQDLSSWNVESAEDMTAMFYGAESFNQNISAWKVGNVTNMSAMFYRASAFNQDLNAWDVSKVTNMADMFRESSNFNGDISNWDVGSVSNMEGMFWSASNFNADISKWDVSKVTVMTRMFSSASAFNQNIGKWNTASLISLYQCFTVASSFNQDLSKWDVSNVTTMNSMFDGTALSTANYDKLLQGWSAQSVQPNIELGAMGKKYCHSADYREALATNYGWTFTDSGLDKDEANYFITTWKSDNTGASGETEIIIPTHPSFTYNYDVDWDNDGVFDDLNVSGTITHKYDVAGTYKIRIRGIFPGMYFNKGGDKEKLISIDQWGTIWWETMENAFNGCANLTCQATDVLDVSCVNNMDNAFLSASLFDINAGIWEVSNLTSAEDAFKGTALSSGNYDQLLSGWGSQIVQSGVSLGTINNTYCMGTYGHDVLTGTYGWTINDLGSSCDETNYFITTWQTDNTGTSDESSIRIPCNSNYNYFYDVDWNNDGVFDEFGIKGDITHTYAEAGTYTIQIRGAFPTIYFDNEDDCEKLISIDQWGAMQWQSLESSFKGCSNLNITATDAPDLSEVTSMEECFQYCSSLTANLNNWDVSNITNMYEVFEDATSFNGGINNWDMSSVTNMGDMFEGATSFNQDLNNWDVSSVVKMTDVFKGATSFNGDICSWDVSKVTDFSQLFQYSEVFNQDISGWNTSSALDMNSMFSGAIAFNQDISSWNVSQVTDMTQMFQKASSFNQDLGSWDITGISHKAYMYDMLNGSNLSSTIYDATLQGWANQAVVSEINLGTVSASYCKSSDARETLINTYSWTINDEGVENEAPVPDVDVLIDIIADCEVTELTAPTATDCVGTVTGIHDAVLPIITQGTTVVTWTYDDGNGNTSIQTQNVVIDDVSNPELTCIADVTVASNNGSSYIVQETEFDLEAYSDNCTIKYISNSINAEETLEGEELPLGDHIITWTIGDMAGNVETCSFTVSVSTATNTTEFSVAEAINVYPNPSNGMVNLEYNTDQPYLLKVYNSSGMLVEQQLVNEKQYQLDLSHLENGIYLVQLIANDKVYTTKLIMQKK
ncbi:MAG: BspA family leucine-rich repeat surface protein [Carboxylicivirga sp.]|jgi:surface protein|nr:BspA family leucine-rich repeat surface protein [Carboxylicivirga sp.]